MRHGAGATDDYAWPKVTRKIFSKSDDSIGHIHHKKGDLRDRTNQSQSNDSISTKENERLRKVGSAY